MLLVSQVRDFFRLRFEPQEILFVGPVSILGTFYVAMQRGFAFDFCLVAIMGIVLSMKKQMEGLFFALVLLGVDSLFKHFFFPNDHHLWQLGIEASLGFGFVLLAVTNEKKPELVKGIENQAKTTAHWEEEVQSARQSLIEEKDLHAKQLQATQKEMQEKLSGLELLNASLQKKVAEVESYKLNEKEVEILNLQKERDELQEKNGQVRKSLFACETELNQLHQSIQELQRTVQEKEKSNDLLQASLKKFSEKEHRYIELRDQFDEKNRVLHETRTELFYLSTQLEARDLEQNLLSAGEPIPEVKRLMADLLSAEERCQELEDENQQLSEWIQSLVVETPVSVNEEKPIAKKRGRKKAINSEPMPEPTLF